MSKRLPSIAWAYAAHVLTFLLRVWALPFALLGWLAGAIALAVSVGFALGYQIPLGEWASDLRHAYKQRGGIPSRRKQPDLDPWSGPSRDLSDFDDDDSEDDDD